MVTANDGDPYGTFILGIFTEKPDENELMKTYNEWINSLEEEMEEGYNPTFYIDSIFELVVS